MGKAWLYLFAAAIFEIGWPLGFKLSQNTRFKISFIVFSAVSMTLSGLFLWTAQKHIPIGTAYAVWTGLGAAGTFLIGIFFFSDPAGMLRVLSFAMIVAGVIGLKISS